jgi:hypothetical protein
MMPIGSQLAEEDQFDVVVVKKSPRARIMSSDNSTVSSITTCEYKGKKGGVKYNVSMDSVGSSCFFCCSDVTHPTSSTEQADNTLIAQTSKDQPGFCCGQSPIRERSSKPHCRRPVNTAEGASLFDTLSDDQYDTVAGIYGPPVLQRRRKSFRSPWTKWKQKQQLRQQQKQLTREDVEEYVKNYGAGKTIPAY